MINKLSNKKRFIKNFKNLKIKNKKFFKVLSVRTLKQITALLPVAAGKMTSVFEVCASDLQTSGHCFSLPSDQNSPHLDFAVVSVAGSAQTPTRLI